jgi:tetratricopeptide (TPR) repeat protein
LKARWASLVAGLATLTALGLVTPATAELFGSRTEARDCSSAVGGDVTNSTVNVVCGMPFEQVSQLMGMAVSGRPGDYTELLQRLDALIPATSQLRAEALARFFAILGEADVSPERLTQKLVEIAERYQTLLAQLDATGSSDPEVQRLKELAHEALQAGDFARTEELLNQAKARDLSAIEQMRAVMEQMQATLNARQLSAAETAAKNGALMMTQIRYADAARYYAEAVGLTPERYVEQLSNYLSDWAEALYRQGDEFGDNGALAAAIERERALLAFHPRERVPLDWAGTQNSLGTALKTLGERESDTARLEQAVEAFRAALLEYTRERVPLQWAGTQNNLGGALAILGERESDTARLEQAVEAFRAALLEYTRERVPLDWAMIQTNLGGALAILGKRKSDTARLEQAVEAFRAALLEYTRERVPLQWAGTQNNLGNALQTLGERESDTARLEQAVEAFRAALLEYTRERVPLDWAMTQNNLGNALQTLGERESDTARLEQAVEAYRAALLEYTRERVPLQWAGTQNNLGNALAILGERESDTARLEQAVEAYRAALQERTRERVPLDWAMIQTNLGGALQTLGKRKSDTAYLEEALAAIKAARKVLLDAGMTQYEAYFTDRIETLEAEITAMDMR